MYPDQNKRMKRILEHAVGVIIAAAVAGLFTFAQEVARGSGLCQDPTAATKKAGLIGGLLKGAHSAIKAKAGTLFL